MSSAVHEVLRGIRGDGMRDAVRKLMSEGWSPIRWTSRNQLLLSHPGGARVTAPCGSSDRHARQCLLRAARNAIVRQRPRQS